MIGALLILLAFQLAGEFIARSTGAPVPGPVIGMVLLFATLALRGRVDELLRDTSAAMLKHLAILFVPAGVGIVQQLGRLSDEAGALAITLVGSTVLTLWAAATAFRLVCRWTEREKG
jgi:holin-like protein